MIDAYDLVRRYLAAWNETDPVGRRQVLEQVWTEDGSYTDPLVEVTGRDAIDEVIGAMQRQFRGLVFRLAGDIDAHHNLARFRWVLGPDQGEALLAGFDVAVTAPDGRLSAVHGFLDKIPAA
jgi:ketosteroid isomerase-like protein